MSYYAVSDTTVIAINPKAGSMAMRASISQTPFVEITAVQALEYEQRVMFIRDPVERVNSLFNMFYHLTTGCSGFSDTLPGDIILAYGARVGSFVGANDHRYIGRKRYDCEARVNQERNGTLSDEQITVKLNNEDYQRYIDYILAGNKDDHWGSQVALSSLDGQLVPNVIHNFSDIDTVWQDYVIAPIKQQNSWPSVSHDDYRLADLQAFYADDIALIGTL